jgi:hypothetical protein
MISGFLVVLIGLMALLFVATRPVRDERNYPGGGILDLEEDPPKSVT